MEAKEIISAIQSIDSRGLDLTLSDYKVLIDCESDLTKILNKNEKEMDEEEIADEIGENETWIDMKSQEIKPTDKQVDKVVSITKLNNRKKILVKKYTIKEIKRWLKKIDRLIILTAKVTKVDNSQLYRKNI